MGKYEVDIDLANSAKKDMAKELETNNNKVLNGVGAFSSLYDISCEGYKEPVLVLKTEEPGSKQLIAAEYNKIENVCYDMINHLVNDCIVMGCKPLTVQDAIICGKMEKDIVLRIVKAVADACKKNECVLTGGETSEQPGVISDGTYILTSSIVGLVEKSEIIDGSAIKLDDAVIALESSGIHTNGYTLVRKIMREHPEIMEEIINGRKFIDEILEPHRCYYNELKALFKEKVVHGLAHITGGGICENLNRILPEKFDAEIDLSRYEILEIFKVLRKYGDIDDKDMIRTFNLGVGMAMVVSQGDKGYVMQKLEKMGVHCYEIGKIVSGTKKVCCRGRLSWE